MSRSPDKRSPPATGATGRAEGRLTRDQVLRYVDQAVPLTGGDMEGLDLTDAFLRGADLSFANLRGADLRNAVLTCANLEGSDLRDAKLDGADLRYANLKGAKLDGTLLAGQDLLAHTKLKLGAEGGRRGPKPPVADLDPDEAD